jgi:hypothetical protein
MVDNLVQNPRQIPDENYRQKKRAFTRGLSGFVRLINRKRPGRPETYQHDNLKNTHPSLDSPCFIKLVAAIVNFSLEYILPISIK